MRESLSTLADLLTRSEFHVGLLIGAVALGILAVLPRLPSWWRAWGMAAAVATLVGVQVVEGRRLGLAGGIALLALGGWAVGHASIDPHRRHLGWSTVGWAAIVAGAAAIPWRGQVDESNWFFLGTPLVAVVVGVLLSRWATSTRLAWLGPLFAITAFAIWTTVPDTELARLLLGLSLPLAFATLPPIDARLTSAGAYALAGVFAWIPALGGESRPASIIGAWACIGVIALLPFAEAIWPDREHLGLTPTFVLHSVLVLIAARVIGLWVWSVPAALAALALYAAALTIVYLLGGRTRASAEAHTRR